MSFKAQKIQGSVLARHNLSKQELLSAFKEIGQRLITDTQDILKALKDLNILWNTPHLSMQDPTLKLAVCTYSMKLENE